MIIYDKLHPKKDLYQQTKLIDRCNDLLKNINKLKIDIIEQKVKNQDWFKNIEDIKKRNENEANKFISEEAKYEANNFMKKYCVEKIEDIIPFIKDFIMKEYFPKDKVKEMEEFIRKFSNKKNQEMTCFNKFIGILKKYYTNNQLIKGKDYNIKIEILKIINGFKDKIEKKNVKKNDI